MRTQSARALFLAAIPLALCVTGISAQVATAYDYTSIKPPNPKVPRFLEGSLDTLAAAHITLIDLITIKYQYSPDKIVGLTPEQRTTRFDVVSKIDPPGVADPVHDPHAYSFMIDALLKNHFRLVVHQTDKPSAQLVLSSNPPKLPACPPDNSSSTTGDHPAIPCITLDEFATRLSNELHIQVLNLINLPGTFAIGFHWAGPPIAVRGNLPRLPPALLLALNTGFGLTLLPAPANGKVLVVDHAELPTILEETRAATDNQ